MFNEPHMPLSNPTLWQRISQFSLDEEAIDLPFSKRLARENGWTLTFAKRAIEEYKKFTYLACVSDTPVTPSDEVDQVWHLHLTYTRSYWDDFCTSTLQRKLHHGPTKGGATEGAKFHGWYEHTKAQYAEEFDASPPLDLWPLAEERFSKPIHQKRISTTDYWMIPKPANIQPHIRATGVAASALLLAGCASIQPHRDQIAVIVVIVCILICCGWLDYLGWLYYKLRRKKRDRKNKGDSGCGSGGGCGGCGGNDNSNSGDGGGGDSGCGGCGGGD
jgi:hypothetical protein